MTQRRIIAIPGSLRRHSYNRALANEAIAIAPDDAAITIFDRLGTLPIYNQDLEHDPGVAVTQTRAIIDQADGLLIATPEYNGSMPGGVKNLIDWVSRPLGAAAILGKPVAVIGASTGQFGAAWAQEDLSKCLTIAGARVLGTDLRVSRADTRFDEHGRLEPELRLQLADILGQLVALIGEAERERLEDAVA